VLMENLGTSRARKLNWTVDPSLFTSHIARAEFHGVRSDRSMGQLPRLRLQHCQRLAGCLSHPDDGGTVANVDMAWADLQTGYAVAAIVAGGRSALRDGAVRPLTSRWSNSSRRESMNSLRRLRSDETHHPKMDESPVPLRAERSILDGRFAMAESLCSDR